MARRRRAPEPRTRYDFATHCFKGKRFDDHTLDVEVLQELLAYKQLVLAAAKHIHKAESGKAARGFDKAFNLAIGVIDGGSFTLGLKASAEAMPLLGGLHPGYQDIFTKARDFVSSAIARADNGIGELPDDVVLGFSRFGKHLEPSDNIVISAPGSKNEVHYNTHVRAAILRSQRKEYEVIATIEGEIRSVSLDELKFGIQLADESQVLGAFSPEDEAKITKALRVHKSVHAQITGLVQYDADGKPTQIARADCVDLVVVTPGADVKQMAIDRQIQDLSTEQDLGEAGIVRLDPQYLSRVADVLHDMTGDGEVPLPYLYATPERTVRAEWPMAPYEIVCDLQGDPMVADVLVVNVESEADYSRTFSALERPEVMSAFLAWVRPFMLREVSDE